jgi:hypothetical protein
MPRRHRGDFVERRLSSETEYVVIRSVAAKLGISTGWTARGGAHCRRP